MFWRDETKRYTDAHNKALSSSSSHFKREIEGWARGEKEEKEEKVEEGKGKTETETETDTESKGDEKCLGM